MGYSAFILFYLNTTASYKACKSYTNNNQCCELLLNVELSRNIFDPFIIKVKPLTAVLRALR